MFLTVSYRLTHAEESYVKTVILVELFYCDAAYLSILNNLCKIGELILLLFVGFCLQNTHEWCNR